MNKGEYKNEGRTVMHAVDEQCIQLTEARAVRQPPSVSRQSAGGDCPPVGMPLRHAGGGDAGNRSWPARSRNNTRSSKTLWFW